MADIEEIEASYNRKVQLEQFEPIEHGVVLEVSLDDDEDPEVVYDEYREVAESMVEHAIAERLAAKKLSDDAEEE